MQDRKKKVHGVTKGREYACVLGKHKMHAIMPHSAHQSTVRVVLGAREEDNSSVAVRQQQQSDAGGSNSSVAVPGRIMHRQQHML